MQTKERQVSLSHHTHSLINKILSKMEEDMFYEIIPAD